MKNQPLKALAFIAVLAGGTTAFAVQAAEVSDVLKAGASKVQAAKTAQQKSTALPIRPMACCKSSSR